MTLQQLCQRLFSFGADRWIGPHPARRLAQHRRARRRLTLRALLCAASVGWATCIGSSVAFAGDVTVFAASSLKTALDQIAADWQAATGDTVVIAYGGTPQLARQVLDGAPADLVIFASADWMQVLEDAGAVDPASRVDLLGNRLVLIGAPGAAAVDLVPGVDLAGALAGGKLAMALVDSVPAGQYGREALVWLGAWAGMEASVVQVENVRAALALVSRGETVMGVVYASDAVAAGGAVAVLGDFPAESHRTIVYPAALVAGGRAGAGFLAGLQGAQAQAVFARQGFWVPAR